MFPKQLIAAPTEEPVSFIEAQERLRLPPDQDAAMIEAHIRSARQFVEEITWRALVTQTWDVFPQRFYGDRFALPLGKVQSVTYLKYTYSSGVETTVSSSDYHVDTVSEPGQIVLAYGKQWPSATLKAVNPIVIRGVFGYGAATAVPQPIKDAILLLVAHRYSHPEPVIVSDRAGARETELPYGIWPLLAPYDARRLYGCR